jgi:YD repeat-containing protein
MKTILFTAVMLIASCQAPLRNAEAQQTRLYDSSGRSVGTSVPQGQGSSRYYDARGNSLGTSTTTGNTTTFYGPSGNVTGKTIRPTNPATKR